MGTDFEYDILGLNIVYVLILIQLTSWILLLIGHDCYEGRRQSIFREFSHYVLSPDLITIKFLEIVFNYKKSQIDQVKRLIENETCSDN